MEKKLIKALLLPKPDHRWVTNPGFWCESPPATLTTLPEPLQRGL